MYDEKIEALISAALADGVLTEKEKQVLFKRAEAEGIDLDEFEMVLDARLVELEKAEKEKAEKSAPKSTKYGDVRKCPVCGAMVPALAGVCPECGYEFSGVDANLSSQKLADLLLKTKDEDKKKEIIETFPIPNTKSDLFEFLTALQPRMKDVSDPLAKSYYKKYQECIAKAKVSFANDVNINPFIISFEKEEKNLKRKYSINRAINWCRNNILRLIIILIAIIIPTSIITRCTKKKMVETKFEKAVETNNAEEIYRLVKIIKPQEHPLGLLTQLVESGNIDAALYLYNHKSSHCSTYNMQFNALYDDAQYTRDACKLLYDALIKTERMDEAWSYHPLTLDNPSSPGNAQQYFSYISDVVNYYCSKGEKDKARGFVKAHLVWFVSNVDNKKSGNDYSDFYSANVNKRLTKQIDNY